MDCFGNRPEMEAQGSKRSEAGSHCRCLAPLRLASLSCDQISSLISSRALPGERCCFGWSCPCAAHCQVPLRAPGQLPAGGRARGRHLCGPPGGAGVALLAAGARRPAAVSSAARPPECRELRCRSHMHCDGGGPREAEAGSTWSHMLRCSMVTCCGQPPRGRVLRRTSPDGTAPHGGVPSRLRASPGRMTRIMRCPLGGNGRRSGDMETAG